MNFKQYLIKEGVLTSERDILIEYLERKGVDIESLDEGVLDKMRGIKGVLLGAVAAANIFASAHGAIMNQDKIDFMANTVNKIMSKEISSDFYKDPYSLKDAEAYASGVAAGLKEMVADKKMDKGDYKTILHQVGEIRPNFEKLLDHVDGDEMDNTSPGDDEPNSIDTNPFNYLSKLTPEEWAENTIKVMKGQRGRAANESHLDSMQDFKSNMVKADTPEASKFYQKAIELLKASGISFTG